MCDSLKFMGIVRSPNEFIYHRRELRVLKYLNIQKSGRKEGLRKRDEDGKANEVQEKNVKNVIEAK